MKNIRQKLNLTTTQFAALISVCEHTVRNYESGKSVPTAIKAKSIMRCLVDHGVPVEDVQAELVKLWVGEQ